VTEAKTQDAKIEKAKASAPCRATVEVAELAMRDYATAFRSWTQCVVHPSSTPCAQNLVGDVLRRYWHMADKQVAAAVQRLAAS
jgi:hypothetical protein